MSLLKSYTCSKCAGILIFDSDQEFFDCPFCGTKFNAADFHEEEIMNQAKESLRKESFSSAKEKFNLILESDPSDFEALKGLILCEIKTSDLESLDSHDIFDPVDIVSLRNLIARVKKQASIKDTAFFNQLLILIDLSDRLKMYQNNIDALYEDDTRATVNQSFKENESRKNRAAIVDAWWGPAIILGSVAFAALFSFTGNEKLVFFLALAGIIVGCILFVIIQDYNPPRQVYENNPIHDAYEMKEYLEARYNHYEKEYGKEFEKLMELNRVPKAKKPDAPVNEDNGGVKSIVDTDHTETVICSKCAGHLYLDKERRVYECRSCGVAYGISLFFGMPMEKALNAMNTGHYAEAKKRFDNILMVNPSSFDALLGRILCAGRWTRISDIDTADIINEDDLNNISELLSDAKPRVTESDRKFLDKLEELIFLLGKICSNNGNLDVLNRKLELIDSISHVYFLAEKTAAYSNGVSDDRNILLNDIESLKKDIRQLSHEFLAIKRNLIQMQIESVLIK